MASNIFNCLVFLLYSVPILCHDDESLGLSPSQSARLKTLTELSNHGHEHDLATKEKRCHDPSHNHLYDLLGSAYNPKILSSISRRDIQKDLIRQQCESCLNAPLCKNQGKCEICSRFCKNIPNDDKIVQLASRFNVEEETGLSEDQDRYYTVGSFSEGAKKELLARLLNIPKNINLERLIILAKNKSKVKPSSAPHPVVIDTAHVFTVNDGSTNEIDLELHGVNSGDNLDELTSKLNKELDAAINAKKKIRGDSHLTPEEIDKIIDHAITQKPLAHLRSNIEDLPRDKIGFNEDPRLGIAGNDNAFEKKKNMYRADHDEEDDGSNDIESTKLGVKNNDDGLHMSDGFKKNQYMNRNNEDEEDEHDMKTGIQEEPKLGANNNDDGFDDGMDESFKKKKKKKYDYYRTADDDDDDDNDNIEQDMKQGLEGIEPKLGDYYRTADDDEVKKDLKSRMEEEEAKLGAHNNDDGFDDGMDESFKKKKKKKYDYYRTTNDEDSTEKNIKLHKEKAILETNTGLQKNATEFKSNNNDDDVTDGFEKNNKLVINKTDNKKVNQTESNENTSLEDKKAKSKNSEISTGLKMRSNEPNYQYSQPGHPVEAHSSHPEYQSPTNYQTQSGYQAQPNHQAQSGYAAQSGYQAQPNHQAQSGYKTQPSYQPQYETEQNHQAQPGYQAQSSYPPQPSYLPQYEAEQNNQANSASFQGSNPMGKGYGLKTSVNEYGNNRGYDEEEELPEYIPINVDYNDHPPATGNQYSGNYQQAPNYQNQPQPQYNQPPQYPQQPQQTYPVKSQAPVYQQYAPPSQPQQANKVQTEQTYRVPPTYNRKEPNTEYRDDNISPIELDEDLPVYGLNNNKDYTVGSKKEDEIPSFEDPQSKANFYEQEYKKLKSLLKERTNIDDSEQPSDKLVKDFTKIIKDDLAEGKKLNNTTDDELNEAISELIEENIEDKNRTETKFENKLDEIASGLEPIVNSQHLEGFRNRFVPKEKHNMEKHHNMAKILGNQRLKLKQFNSKFDMPKKDAVLGDKRNQIEDNPIIDKLTPLVDPKLLNLKNIVKDIKTVPNYLIDKAEKVADAMQNPNKFRQMKNALDTNKIPQVGNRNSLDDGVVGDALNDTVACKMKKLLEDSDEYYEEKMYLQPNSPYENYGKKGGYRNAEKNGNKKLLNDLDRLLHPHQYEKKNDEEQVTIPSIPTLIKDLENLRLPTLPPMPAFRHLNRQSQPQSTPPQLPPPQIQLNGERFDPSNQNPKRLDEFPQQQNRPQFPQLRNHQEEPMQPFNPNMNFQPEMRQGFNNIVGAPNAEAEEGKINTNIDENGQPQMYFLGDGIKFPLQMVHMPDGSKHLTVDMDKLCKCNNTFCFNDTQVGMVNEFADEPLQMALPDFDRLESEHPEHINNFESEDQNRRNSDLYKRSPLGEPDYMYKIKNPDEVNRNLENKFNAYKNDLVKYYDNEKNFQDSMNENQEKEKFDDDVKRRVGLVTNVLSWMKDVAIDGVPHHAE